MDVDRLLEALAGSGLRLSRADLEHVVATNDERRFAFDASGDRHAVHLSADVDTARAVGARRGRPVVLRVSAGPMAAEGFSFSRSANGVWLVAAVLPRYLSRLGG